MLLLVSGFAFSALNPFEIFSNRSNKPNDFGNHPPPLSSAAFFVRSSATFKPPLTPVSEIPDSFSRAPRENSDTKNEEVPSLAAFANPSVVHGPTTLP